MKKNFYSVSLLFIILQFFISCQSKTVTVAILHTNDIHGKLENFDELAALKEELIPLYDTLLLFNAGDIFSGNPYVDFYPDKGYPVVDMLNRLGYNLATLGNHEFDFGQDILIKRIEQANYPTICANMDPVDSPIEKLPSFADFTVGDIRFSVFGILETSYNNIPSTHPDKITGITFYNPLKTADSILQGYHKKDALIALTHIGYEDDSILAENHPEIDVIIGGHSHTLIADKKINNNVLVAQTGRYLQNAGLIELKFKNRKLVSKTYRLISLKDYPRSDSTILKLVGDYSHNKELDTVIGFCSNGLKNKQDLGYLFTDAQLSIHPVDFAFQNFSGIRVDSLPAGDITPRMIYEMDPFENELVICELKVKDIKKLIESSYNLDKKLDLYISGGSYQVVIDSANSVKDITVFDKNGRKLYEDKTYSIGLSSYIASSYNFNKLSIRHTNTKTAENLIRYVKGLDNIKSTQNSRTSVLKK